MTLLNIAGIWLVEYDVYHQMVMGIGQLKALISEVLRFQYFLETELELESTYWIH